MAQDRPAADRREQLEQLAAALSAMGPVAWCVRRRRLAWCLERLEAEADAPSATKRLAA